MRHTDEWTLHAHLDGELTPAETAELKAHLATCASCRERLDAARTVRDRAHAILRRADPPPVAMPDFATLRARRFAASAPVAPPKRTSRGLALAWAASVVAALGAGWFAQSLLRGGGGGEMVAVSSTEAEMAEAPADFQMSAPPPAAMQAPARAAEPATGPVSDAGGAAAAAPRRAEALDPRAASPSSPLAKDLSADENLRVAADVQSEGVSERAFGYAAPPPPAALRGLRATAAVESADTASGGWPGSDGWVAVDEDEAAARLGRAPSTLPDLPIVGHAVAADGSQAIRVTQRLPEGAEVEILQRPSAAREDGIEVDVRAQLPADSLERLRRAVR